MLKLFDRLDRFVLISNLVWVEWRVYQICIAAYRDRRLEREREREKASKTRGDYATAIQEQRYMS